MVEEIINTINNMKRPFTNNDLYLLLKNYEKEEIDKVLSEEVKKYNLIIKKGKYVPISQTNYKKGLFKGYKLGGGKVTVISSYFDKNGELKSNTEEYIIKSANSKNAIDSDVVLIEKKEKNKKEYYEIKEIINRKINTVLGEVFSEDGKFYVRSNDKKKKDLIINLSDEEIVGSTVIASLDEKISDNVYCGSVKKVLKNKDSAEEEFIELAYQFGIESFFSDEALREAEKVPNSVRKKDLKNRLDLRYLNTFTIDGADTKDMDDAVSINVLQNGNYLLGVHIADPTYYIKENSALDREAITRGTSVYAFNQVIPMLPPKLSNGICSLNPNVDRLTISALIEIDKEGNVLDCFIDQAVIKSRKKMNYDDVNKILEENIIPNGYEDYVSNLKKLYKLSLIIKKRKLEEGMLDIDIAEPTFYPEEDKIVYKIKEQRSAEELIEFLMITANEEISKYMKRHDIPIINRIHPAPDSDKIKNLTNFIKNFGIIFDKKVETNSDYLQELVDKAKEKQDIKDIVLIECVKSLKRALYSTEDMGHFGLGTHEYVHFTSPIRRGPDYILHRQIHNIVLSKKNSEENKKKWALKLPTLAYQFSNKERVADQIERIAKKHLAHDYMRDYVGKKYNGTITSFECNYMNIVLDNLIEGRVLYDDLDSVYVLTKNKQKLLGTKDNFNIGDRLQLQVQEFINDEDSNIYFDIISKIGYNKKEDEKQLVKKRVKKYL